MEFKLIEFNPRRHMRGVEAAKVECDGQWMWMSKTHIISNIKSFGNCLELQKALECYKTPSVRFPAPTN